MNTTKFRWVLYFIILVIISTITIQVYWNYKNYQINKQQLINDVQVSLDNSIDTYYENLAKQNTMGFVINGNSQANFFEEGGEFSSIINGLKIDENGLEKVDSISRNLPKGITIIRGFEADSLNKEIHNNNHFFKLDSIKNQIESSKFKSNNTQKPDFEFLTSKVVLSITNDTLKLKDIDSLLQLELNRKALNLDYSLTFNHPNKDIQIFNALPEENKGLSTSSKSLFLPENSILNVHFKNETKLILKRILSGILLSTLLVLAVISCLFYLLNIINKQKQLAEVKNDLISNITHEFKTPIATIGVALESIKDFNVIDDKEKTKKYLNLSTNQLSKLNVMVEKLLETATLDSDNLELNKENINISQLLNLQVEKHQMQTQEKELSFSTSPDDIIAKIDGFHFENAINNIIDNAVKYGGDSIKVNISKKENIVEIAISDTGNSLTQEQSNQIFEKFYRVPKGNTHDIKGFGIGLYYTKKIIEKHGGTISVDLSNNTIFNITIPNEY
ncbi:ATP-binding protein [uncultured Lacinutrix sp.]|uniref:sensor histidine kinase n=1 Tax=uncultured Lacinutrix sp. TaxID=574032 RepID=UPI00260A15E5|nr:ATP-binding protein [uncultured Lacinutrix sp.]